MDKDIQVLERCCKALDQSSSPRMLAATLRFLWDRYLVHQPKTIPKHLKVPE